MKHKVAVDILSYTINYKISRFGVHIECDEGFHCLIRNYPNRGIKLLADELIEKYELARNRTLKIRKDSIIVEIWGHYYFEVLYKKTKWIIAASIFTPIRERLERATKQIDIAEFAHDSNRWVWNIFAPLKGVFQLFLKDKA